MGRNCARITAAPTAKTKGFPTGSLLFLRANYQIRTDDLFITNESLYQLS